MLTIPLPPDQAPWLSIAQSVLRGEFNRAGYSTLKSLEIGLRSIKHETCQKAVKALALIEKKPTV